jgi:hypothetical protein
MQAITKGKLAVLREYKGIPNDLAMLGQVPMQGGRWRWELCAALAHIATTELLLLLAPFLG